MILGIDISTSKIGYSVIDYSTNLIECQLIKWSSFSNAWFKCLKWLSQMCWIDVPNNAWFFLIAWTNHFFWKHPIKSNGKKHLIAAMRNSKGEIVTSRADIANVFADLYQQLYVATGDDAHQPPLAPWRHVRQNISGMRHAPFKTVLWL